MTINELNEYILNYYKNDKTHSAIMLTAPWGMGKSYYIKNNLIPLIDSNNERNCIVISLYGLKDIAEISKSIYFELRAKKLNNISEKANVGIILGKTVLKGIAGFFGIDLTKNEEDLQKLYESIDLSDKLIIFEDIERSGIDIIELMGYVNNLCEQDGVKVLLVANEKEILKYETKEIEDVESNGKKNKTGKFLTSKSSEYLKIKEKTLSDTIIFPPYVYDALISIMRGFHNDYFNSFLEEKTENGRVFVADVIEREIMGDKNIMSYNLRSFIIACQKTIEIYNHLTKGKEHNLEYLKYILFANSAFLLQKKQNDNISWCKKDGFRSGRLGTSKYPLPKFCYDYICFQYLNQKDLDELESIFGSEQNYATNEKDVNEDLTVIYTFYEKTEKEVIDALNKLKIKLKSLKVPFSEYGKLANYLVSISFVLEDKTLYDEYKTIMLTNLKEASPESVDAIREYSGNGMCLDNKEQMHELNLFIEEMLSVLSEKNKETFNFDYKPENIDKIYKYIFDNRDSFINKRVFASKLDNEKLVELLKNSSSRQIRRIRSCFSTVYSFSNINEFFVDDRESLQDLKGKVEELIINNTKIDKIQKLQLNYLVSNLNDYIERLNKEW